MRVSALMHLLINLPVTYLFKLSETNEDESELKKDFNQLNFNTFPQMGETGENSTNEKDTKIENTNSSEKESNKERTDLCYWKGLHAGIRHRPESLLWYLISFLLAYVFYMPFFTLPFYTTEKTGNQVNPARLLGLLTTGEVIMYAMIFILGNHIKGYIIYVYLVCTALLSVLYISWTYMDFSLDIIYILTIVLGLNIGLFVGYWFVSCGEICDMSLGINIPICFIFLGLGIISTPFLTGFVYDTRDSFRDLFMVTGGLSLVQMLVIVIIVFIKQIRKYNNSIINIKNENESLNEF